ncbi:MAG TPA: DUF1127 domain-containing protein [Alphaproteobacteria bacterium]|nr:DUF1127 domain-containing protein [Alphaproteobacteria bacterium]
MTTYSPSLGRLPTQAGGGNFDRIRRTASKGSLKLRRGLARALDTLATWRAQARTRRELMSLSADALKDIGIGRSEAYSEYSKPFWRA